MKYVLDPEFDFYSASSTKTSVHREICGSTWTHYSDSEPILKIRNKNTALINIVTLYAVMYIRNYKKNLNIAESTSLQNVNLAEFIWCFWKDR
jgi:hypothetical protein